MKQAVIVSTARTGLAKSVRGGFNQTHCAVLGGHAVQHAIARAEPAGTLFDAIIVGVEHDVRLETVRQCDAVAIEIENNRRKLTPAREQIEVIGAIGQRYVTDDADAPVGPQEIRHSTEHVVSRAGCRISGRGLRQVYLNNARVGK